MMNGECKMIVQMSKGRQITIPAKLRDLFQLNTGSKLEISTNKKEIILKPIGYELEELFKEAKKKKPRYKLTAEDMDKFNKRLFS